MSIGIWQLVLILVIVFVLFGAGKLPRVMGDLGRGVRSLREGLKSGDADSAEGSSPTNKSPTEPRQLGVVQATAEADIVGNTARADNAKPVPASHDSKA